MEKNRYSIWGGYGLERETLRVDQNGRLAQTPHPFTDSHIQRDFCEYQIELITPVCQNMDSMMTKLERLDRRMRTVLEKQSQKVWLYSNPPSIENESEICVAQYHDKEESKYAYRKQLEERYGKQKMLYSGIHFNLSFSKSFLEAQAQLHQNQTDSISDLQNQLYFRLFKQISRYSWLLVLLTSASPIYEKSLEQYGVHGTCFDGFASMRSGKKGYWNQFIPVLDYSDLSSYVESVQQYVQAGTLFSASELYLPVRLKPKGENSLSALMQNGIDHLELRMFDLNPLEPLGIAKEDLIFSCFLLEYLLTLEDFDFTPSMQVSAIRNHQAAAKYCLDTITIDGIPAKLGAEQILRKMNQYFAENPKAQKTIAYESEKLHGKRPCQKIKQQLDETYTDSILRLSRR